MAFGVNQFGIFFGIAVSGILSIQFRILKGHFFAAMSTALSP
jgi:hypothetical protein